MKKLTAIIALILVMAFILPACTPAATSTVAKTTEAAKTTEVAKTTEEPFVLPDYALPYDAENVILVPEGVYNYMYNNADFKLSSRKADTTIRNYAHGDLDINAPEGIILAWKGTGSTEYTLVLATNESMENARQYKTAKNEVKVNNLLTGTKYWWYALDKDGKKITDTYSFTTEENQPRTISVDGVKNVRDIGGFASSLAEGAVVRQGLIYRSASLNNITEAGVDTFVNELGIKTDLDLRKNTEEELEAVPSDLLTAAGVKYVNCPVTNYEKIFNDDYADMIAEIKHCFEVFADESNYPIDFHCAIGTDRTGTIGYLLQGLLGIDTEIAYKHYYLSWFSSYGEDVDARVESFFQMYFRLSKYKSKNNTLAENVEAYLLEIGVTQEQIDSVRRIMVEYPEA